METMEGKQIPREYRAPFTELTADFIELKPRAGSKIAVRAWWNQRKNSAYTSSSCRGRRGLWGPPNHVAARLRDLSRRGLDQWLFYAGGADIDRSTWIDRFSSEVIPLLET